MKIDVLGNGYIELIDSMGDDLSIVNAAKVSFNKEAKKLGKDELKLLKYLYDHKHTTPFEMVEFKFRVKLPLFVIRQWHRHRTWSYNEISRRYTSDEIDFYYPTLWRKQSTSNKQGSDGFCDPVTSDYAKSKLSIITTIALENYNDLIKLGACREQARMMLPQNMMTIMIAKVDLHNLLHFLKLRTDTHAQWEIRQYAEAIEKLIDPIVPETMKLYRDGK